MRVGSHGIGHTRLSTESRVDLSHSQPFWAHGEPDLATVHNGHITNYHKLRRQYEERGYRFLTENDSEVIGIYLRDRMAAGLSLEDALRSSLDDFDGSFCYLAASAERLAFVKDRYGFKPLVVAETDDFVAIATEEIALRRRWGMISRPGSRPRGRCGCGTRKHALVQWYEQRRRLAAEISLAPVAAGRLPSVHPAPTGLAEKPAERARARVCRCSRQ